MENHKKSHGLNWGVFLAFIVFAVLSTGILIYVQKTVDEVKQQDQALRQATLSSCSAISNLKAWLIIDAGQNARQPQVRQQRALKALPIRNCPVTVEEGKTVFLSTSEQNLYLQVYAEQLGLENWKAPSP